MSLFASGGFSLLLLLGVSLLAKCEGGCPYTHSGDNREDVFEWAMTEENDFPEFVEADPDPLVEMNIQLQQNYVTTKKRLLHDYLNKYPLIFNDGINFYFWHNRNYQNYSAIPPIYTELKLVCHVALGTYTLLDNPLVGNGTLTPELTAQFQQYLDFIPAALDSLPERGFNEDQLQKSTFILNRSAEILQKTISDSYVSLNELKHYAKGVVGPISSLVDDAALAQLLLTNQLVRKFQATLTDDEWNNLHVVLLGSHMARHGHIYMQYFGEVLDTKPSSGERIIFAESLDMHGAMDLMGTHLIDMGAGEVFYDNPSRLHFDILASGVHKYLPFVLGQKNDN